MASKNIRSAVYSNIHVYELVVRGIAVMIRKSDGFVNATQILRAAGLPKPARTKVLEREVTRGVHEKVQGGYAGSQGTWIPLDSAISLAEQYRIYEECSPLFNYDMLSGAAEASSPPQKSKKAKPGMYHSDMSSPEIEKRNKPTSPPGYISKETPSPIQPPAEPLIKYGRVSPILEENPNDEYEEPTPIALRREARATKSRVKSFADHDDDDDEYSSGADAMIGAGTSSRPTKRQRNNNVGSSVANSNAITAPTVAADQQQRTYQEFSPKALASAASTIANAGNFESPMAGKKCQHCGVTETPQWRRGPSGKRTLCNACGVKWSSGRLHIPAIHSSPLFFSVSETETNHSASDHGGAGSGDEAIEVGTTAWKLQLEVGRLKSKLRETEKSQKKLEKLLAEGQASDRELDRCYRKILSGAKRSHPVAFSSKHSRKIDDLFHKYQEEYDGDLADDEGTISVRFGDSSERERMLERNIITKFVQCVQRDKVLSL